MKGIISTVELFSQDEILRIHTAALRLLEKTGLSMPNEECLRRCEKAGARVDYVSGILRIPAPVMEEYIAILRKEGASKTPVHRPKLTGYISTQIFVTDYKTKTKRLGTSDDIMKGIALVRHLKNIPSSPAVVIPSDVPGKISDLHSYHMIYKYSEKDGGTYVINPEAAPYIMDMAEAVGRKTGYLFETIAPLRFRSETLEMGLMFADRGHYLSIAPMIMGGSTGPVTIAGTLTLITAEVLASLFAVWALTGKPSAFFANGSHTTDPRTMLCSFGSPNQALIGVGVAQMAKFYGIPSGSNSALSDSLMPDFQCGFEKTLSAVFSLLAGSSSIGCQGIVGADQGFSFEQLAIDNEWIDAYNYVLEGAEVSAETIAEEIIEEVGIGGHFLSEEHTVGHLSDSWWRSRLFDRFSFENYMEDGGRELLDKASRLVEEYTAGYKDQPPVLEPAKVEEIDRIYQAGIKQILG